MSLSRDGTTFTIRRLLEFIAENPVRHGKLPANIVEIAKVILDAGAEQSALNETLMLVATGSVPRECRMQLPLIDLLCDRGADPNSAIHAAVLHGEMEAVDALIRRGARIDLPIAAALGRIEEFRRLLPQSRGDDRHLALALASQFGHGEIVRIVAGRGRRSQPLQPGRRPFAFNTVAPGCRCRQRGGGQTSGRARRKIGHEGYSLAQHARRLGKTRG